jgi:hypothetical protein
MHGVGHGGVSESLPFGLPIILNTNNEHFGLRRKVRISLHCLNYHVKLATSASGTRTVQVLERLQPFVSLRLTSKLTLVQTYGGTQFRMHKVSTTSSQS